MKWGILSTGRMANIFADALEYVEEAELLAVGSRNTEKSKKFAEKHHILRYYGSYEELLSRVNM